MPAPLAHVVGEYIRNPKVRRIDYEYHVQCITEHNERTEKLTRQLRDIERAHLAVSIHHAVSQYDQLRNIDANLGRIADAISGIGSLIESSTDAIIDAVDSLGDLLEDGFETVSTEIAELHETMRSIDQKIAQQYETRARELRASAKAMMLHGMLGDKHDRKANYRDALNLYQECERNPIGKIDMQTQFDLGWLEWKVNRDYKKAKEHFDRAWRLSRNDALPDKIQIRNGRHFAHMCYRMKDYQKAYMALHSLPHYDSFVSIEMARYLWKLGDTFKPYFPDKERETKNKARRILLRMLSHDGSMTQKIVAEKDFRNDPLILEIIQVFQQKQSNTPHSAEYENILQEVAKDLVKNL